MKNRKVNHAVLAGLVFSTLISPAAVAACKGTDLSACPAPFDTTLPDTHKMLTWSQADRVVGFRNDYRNYPGDVFRHGSAVPLEMPASRSRTHTIRSTAGASALRTTSSGRTSAACWC